MRLPYRTLPTVPLYYLPSHTTYSSFFPKINLVIIQGLSSIYWYFLLTKRNYSSIFNVILSIVKLYKLCRPGQAGLRHIGCIGPAGLGHIGCIGPAGLGHIGFIGQAGLGHIGHIGQAGLGRIGPVASSKPIGPIGWARPARLRPFQACGLRLG